MEVTSVEWKGLLASWPGMGEVSVEMSAVAEVPGRPEPSAGPLVEVPSSWERLGWVEKVGRASVCGEPVGDAPVSPDRGGSGPRVDASCAVGRLCVCPVIVALRDISSHMKTRLEGSVFIVSLVVFRTDDVDG